MSYVTSQTPTDNRVLTAKQVADFLQVTAQTLNQWRYLDKGPRYIKQGKLIRYRQSDIDTWLEERAS